MDSIVSDLTELKVSALSKSKEINKFVKDVTIGPNSLKHEKTTVSQTTEIKSVDKVDKNAVISNAISTYSPFKEIYKNFERQRVETIQEAIQLHRERFLLFNREQKLQQKKSWLEKKQLIVNNMQQQEVIIMQAMQQHEIDSSKQHEQLLKYYQEIAEKRKKNDKQIQEKEEKHRHLTNLIEKIFTIQQEFRKIYTELLDTLKTCSEEMKGTLSEYLQQLKSLPPLMDEIINKCKSNNVCEDDVVICSDLYEMAKKLKDAINNNIADHNRQVDEQNAKDQEKTELARLAAEAQAKESKSASDAAIKDNFKFDFVSKTALKTYSDLHVFLENYVAGYADLENNPANKTLKFDLKKAINTPVNSISDVSCHHLTDKYNKLNALLSGQPIQMGDSNIIATRHPQGIAFAMDLLAKKFVLQGEIISSNAVAAYPYATTILSLWNNFPDFGKLFMAHLHSECPYIVPIYFPKTVDQSDQEYYQCLGYKYSDGVVETQDKFLKRMTGIMRLYCAILISHPKSNQTTHPHDLTNGWRWFTNILNLQPCIDITATLIHIFLEVCGYSMLKTYKNQFRKTLEFLMDNYLHVLKKIDTGGPVTRLELLLQEYKKSGMIMPPTGLISKHFW
ncbi:PREDICTED: nucleoporin GLE1 [Nicrophorus vespilloides]|uniref:mRNA export factor GLE1 n=1 Tax=Nicrophorus vespilloides TaxID=110193 RepID=A0ABM1N401_NICVS|nr:PREDICTED: nucleoporin GLE1 [Nicrophorus vespilloides]XP_017781551.1 PREDICTED: nucleoporin GLE1 [Nicrophorus vespilloides]XP_017781559.1 PREDICTED: nucleoporin GLE1 [Nicrophorus vespilloides]